MILLKGYEIALQIGGKAKMKVLKVLETKTALDG